MKLKISWPKYLKQVYLVAAVVSFGIGGFIAYLGNNSGNPLLILVGFVGLAGGLEWPAKVPTLINVDIHSAPLYHPILITTPSRTFRHSLPSFL